MLVYVGRWEVGLQQGAGGAAANLGGPGLGKGGLGKKD